MSGRRTILQSATFTLILIAATSAQSPPDARAEDACLAKPDATTPPGQHWYYRIDHATINANAGTLDRRVVASRTANSQKSRKRHPTQP